MPTPDRAISLSAASPEIRANAMPNNATPHRLLNRETLVEAIKYFCASLAALIFDAAVMLALHRLAGFDVIVAAGIGFSAGIIVIYALSVRHVFNYRKYERRPGREIAWFIITSIVGLAMTLILLPMFHGITTALPVLDTRPNAALLGAKILTAGIVFTFNFLARKIVLFMRSPQTQSPGTINPKRDHYG